MNFTELKYCPSTLAEGFTTYSPAAIRNMFYGKKVSHILEFNPPEMDDEAVDIFDGVINDFFSEKKTRKSTPQ